MARKYGASDLGSEWVNVPRNFRGRKPTSSPTTLAYITAPERGLLKQYALMKTGKDQVGPEGIPSYDDSGFNDPRTRKFGTYTPGSYLFGSKPAGPAMPGKPKNYRSLSDIRKDAQPAWGKEAADEAKQAPGTPAVSRAKSKTFGTTRPTDIHPPISTSKPKDKDRGGRDCPHGWTGTWPNCKPPQQDQDTGTEDTGETDDNGETDTDTDKDCPPEKGRMYQGKCYTECENTMGEEYTGTHPNCVKKSTGESVDGNAGGGGGDVNTILKPDFSFDLLALSDEMDIRNALSNIMNKNNPLFKQARTRALQAMAARGVVNSSMAEEAVMSAMLDVAVPIAEKLVTDLQNVMYRNQERGDAFKIQMNEMYMKELVARMELAGNYRLQNMTESHANWRSYVEAMLGGASISDTTQFDKYMDMISGMKPGSYTSASRSSGKLGL